MLAEGLGDGLGDGDEPGSGGCSLGEGFDDDGFSDGFLLVGSSTGFDDSRSGAEGDGRSSAEGSLSEDGAAGWGEGDVEGETSSDGEALSAGDGLSDGLGEGDGEGSGSKPISCVISGLTTMRPSSQSFGLAKVPPTFTSKCRWQPVEKPVLPTRAMPWPWAT